MRYGVPYKGSKNFIAAQIAAALPRDGFGTFVDLFAGGCAVTHAVIAPSCSPRVGGFGRYVLNDLDGGGVRLFVDAVAGKYHDERRWISREDFFRLKDSDPYVRLCWSFGDNGRSYLYAKEIEPWKKALHFARVLGDCSLLREIGVDGDGSRADVRLHRDEYKAKYIRWWLGGVSDRSDWSEKSGVAKRLQSLQRLQSLERLEGGFRAGRTCQTCQTLQDGGVVSPDCLSVSFKSYDEVEIPRDALVYCDPPYKGTRGYFVAGEIQAFDHAAFYDWCGRQEALVVISEYQMPGDRFVCVKEMVHRSRMSDKVNNAVTEKLFVPKGQARRWYDAVKRPRWRQGELFDY